LWAGFESPAEGPRLSREKGRRWELSIRVFGGYNDNVNVVPEETYFDGSTRSTYLGLQADAAYRLYQTRDLTLGLALSADRIWYLDDQEHYDPSVNDDAKEYNLFAIQPAVYVERRFRLLDLPAAVGASYQYRYEETDEISSGGLRSHGPRLYFDVKPWRGLTLGLAYTLSVDDYDVTFDDENLNSRDGERHNVELSGRYAWNRGRQSVKLAYGYTVNNADGRNFEYDAQGVTGQFRTHVVGPLWFGVDLGYRHADYDGFVSTWLPGPGRERQDVYEGGLQLIWQIDRHWAVDLFANRSLVRSNSARFEGDINNVGMGTTFTF
jgi:hypothetical protein